MRTKLEPKYSAPEESAQAVPLPIDLAGGMRYSKWCQTVGIPRTTGWKYRKQGRVEVIVRNGVSYITAAGIHAFFTNDGSKARCPVAGLKTAQAAFA